MQLLKKIAKLKIFSTKLMLVLTTLVLFGLISCTENSDKIVAESQEVKQIEIDDIDDESFKFNTSSLIESVIQIDGIIKDVNYLNNRTTIILKGKENSKKLVICDMQDNQKLRIKSLHLGDDIKVKGILKGTLNDIILLNCIIPQQQTNE